MDNSNKNEKPKVIATIDVNVHWPKVERADWLEESLDDHLNCVLCGSSLTFKHKTDFVEQIVQEEAHCPFCRVRNRETAHRLQ